MHPQVYGRVQGWGGTCGGMCAAGLHPTWFIRAPPPATPLALRGASVARLASLARSAHLGRREARLAPLASALRPARQQASITAGEQEAGGDMRMATESRERNAEQDEDDDRKPSELVHSRSPSAI